MTPIMAEAPLARLSRRDGWRLLKNVLGGTVILALWLSLWAWVAVGVVGPLSSTTRTAGEPARGATTVERA